MTQTPPPIPNLPPFLTRWQSAGGAERVNYQLFLTELCDLLQVPHPNPATPDDAKNTYVFDRAITATNADGSTSTNFIDLYHRAHFVLETKQGIHAQGQGTRSVSAGPSSSPNEGSTLAKAATDVPPRKPPKRKQGHGIRNSKIWDEPSSAPKPKPKTTSAPSPTTTPPSSSSWMGGAEATPSKPTPTSPASANPTPRSLETFPLPHAQAASTDAKGHNEIARAAFLEQHT